MSPESVSYTHLDVYKRQILGSGRVERWAVVAPAFVGRKGGRKTGKIEVFDHHLVTSSFQSGNGGLCHRVAQAVSDWVGDDDEALHGSG